MQDKKQTPDQQAWLPHFPFACNRQGQAMVEFLIVLPVLLMLILGAIQVALIYQAKITLNYAAYEGVRAGTLGEAEFSLVQEGFARDLAPLYSYSLDDGKHHKDNKEAYEEVPWGWWTQVTAFQKGRQHVLDEFKARSRFARIERLHPDNQSFADFAPGNDVSPEERIIPNSNLRYRPKEVKHRSDESVQDANLLQLRFTYWYPLYVPVVNRFIFNLFICCKPLPSGLLVGDTAEGDGMCKWREDPVCQGDDPRIPLTAVAAMRMQSRVSDSEGYWER